MSVDIGANLLLDITADFQQTYNEDITIRVLEKRLNGGKATMEDVARYSERVGEILSQVYDRHVSEDVLPNGRMYWNIAQKVIGEPLVNNYNLVAEASVQALDAENARQGVKLKAQKPALNQDRIDGLKNKVANAERYDDVAFVLDEPVKNFTRSVVDDAVQTNADFQAKAGLDVKIIRSTTGRETCDWCRHLAGTYDYADVRKTGHDVWKRHAYCDCRIEYVSSTERYDVENFKKLTKAENREKIAQRKAVKANDDRAPEKIAARKALAGVGEREQLSDLGIFSKRLLQDEKIDAKYYKAVRTKFSHGSDAAKRAFNKFVPENAVADYSYLGIPNQKAGTIRLNWQEDIDGVRGPCVTWFHEHGHLIDVKAGFLSHDKEFYRLLEEDYNKCVEGYVRKGHREEIAQTLIGVKLLDMRKHSAVSDLMGAFSGNKASGCAHHSKEYWTSCDVVAEEAFAHMYEAQFDDLRYKEMKQYFPTALKYFEQKLEVASRD